MEAILLPRDFTEARIWRSARPTASLLQGRVDWYRIEAKAGEDAADVYIYDEIGYFGVTANDFVRDLRNITQSKIVLHLNTPGGDVFDGIAIYNALKAHKAAVNVIVDGLAASAGSFIAMAGDRVVMAPHSKMMIHEAFGLAIGNAADMTKMAERLDATSANIASIYAERAGESPEFWRSKMKAETWYTDQQAVDAGLADEVSRDAVGEDNRLQVFDLSIFKHPDGVNSADDEPDEETPDEPDASPVDGPSLARRELEAAIARVRL